GNFLIGSYTGSGVGLSTSADAVNLFNASGNRVTGVQFGASTTGFSFDNTLGIGSAKLPLPSITTLSAAGINGAFLPPDRAETGSPGAGRVIPCAVWPPHAEGCNGTDDDCNGLVDDGFGPGVVGASADTAALWPPDHRMVGVHVNVSVTGACPTACAAAPV